MDGPDRRGSYRLDVSIVPAETLIAIGGRMARSLAVVMHDLSAEGAQLSVLTADLHRGQRLQMRFALGGEPYKVAAEVRWVRQSRRGNGQYVGVRFQDLAPADRRRIIGEIAQEQRRRLQTGARR